MTNSRTYSRPAQRPHTVFAKSTCKRNLIKASKFNMDHLQTLTESVYYLSEYDISYDDLIVFEGLVNISDTSYMREKAIAKFKTKLNNVIEELKLEDPTYKAKIEEEAEKRKALTHIHDYIEPSYDKDSKIKYELVMAIIKKYELTSQNIYDLSIPDLVYVTSGDESISIMGRTSCWTYYVSGFIFLDGVAIGVNNVRYGSDVNRI